MRIRTYKILIVANGYNYVEKRHYEKQEEFIESNKAIMYVALFGCILSCIAIIVTVGELEAFYFSIGAFFWYILGYQQCQSLLDKENDSNEFFEVTEQYKKENPDNFDKNGFYISK